MISVSKKLVYAFFCLSLLLALIGVQPAYAASIVVNTDADSIVDDGLCTLREAITAANTDAEVSGCPAGSGNDTITFAGNYTITLGSQLPAVSTAMTINGTGLANTIIQANAAFNVATYRIFQVASNGNLTLNALTVQNGRCNGSCALLIDSGGGILNLGDLTITNSKVANNSSNDGGGILTTGSDSSLTVTNSIFSGDATVISGFGGAISNGGSVLTITNSTFSNNFTSNSGGAIYNDGPDENTNTITNSTFSGNTSGNVGGAIFNAATLTIRNSTFSGNSGATSVGAAINNQALSTLNLYNTIIANSGSNRDCYNSSGTVNASNNLMENAGTTDTCGLSNGVNGNIIGSDPSLGPLADNGGLTQTHALLTSSPALSTGTNTGCPSTDQRGVARPQFLVCDIGAVESNTQQNSTLVVNTNEDTDDGFCDAFVAGVTDCTLREAINYANNTAGTWTITFAADYTITLNDQLTTIGTIIINGNGASNTIIQANAAPETANRRVFLVNTGSTLTLNQVTVRHGVCAGLCEAPTTVGGGIHVKFSGTLTINNSLISDNYADDGGGGLHNGGVVTITNSTFSDNSTLNSGGAITNQGTMTISNSTVANNEATSGSSFAGGIRTSGIGTTLNIYNSTISGNTSSSAVDNGSNIYQDSGSGTLNLYNTIVANGTDGDCFAGGSITAINTLIESTGTNACGLTDGANGNIIGSDPDLGTLTSSPAYFPLIAGSPAINAGDNTICAASPVSNTSQNGVTRPQGAVCDIGSFEKTNIIPTSATFGDVPMNHPYWLDIEILYANGFTAGCSTSPLLFCPEETMNRGQSAVFILRGNFGPSYVPPNPPYASAFGDSWTPGPWAQKWAQGMLAEGLTAGCSVTSLLFCPWDQMPRLQAAVFGMRLLNGNTYVPPAATGTVFADITDPNIWYAKWAEQAYLSGILPNCGTQGGKPLFCPNGIVNRGLGAYMIVRAKNLSMP